MIFDWQQFRKDLRWADPMKDYRSWRSGTRPKTQKERAEILGTSQAKLSRIEAGSNSLKINEFVEFCEKMKVEPQKYFIREENE